jgi:hypothetical protein
MRNSMTLAITAILTLTFVAPASAERRRGDAEHIGLYNFVMDISATFDHFPEGPIGDEQGIIDPTYFPEGPIGVTGDLDGDFVSVIDGTFIVDGSFHGGIDATLDRDRDGALTLAGIRLPDAVEEGLRSGRGATVEMTLTCTLDEADLPMPYGLLPGETGDYDCQAAIDGVDAGQLTSLLCAVGHDTDEELGFGSDDFLREFDSDGELVRGDGSSHLTMACGM